MSTDALVTTREPGREAVPFAPEAPTRTRRFALAAIAAAFALPLFAALPASGARAEATDGPAVDTPAATSGCPSSLDLTRDRIRTLSARGHASVLMDIDGEAAEIWIAKLNLVPPRTAFAGDTVLAIAATWSPNVLFAIFKDGCEVTRGALRPQIYRAIDRAATTAFGVSV